MQRVFYTLNYQRRSGSGVSLLSWLTDPGDVLVKRCDRTCRNEPPVNQAKLVYANPYYALIPNQNGSESIVSTQHLARPPSEILDSNPPPGIYSHRRPENNINNNVGPQIYCEGNDSPVQSERNFLLLNSNKQIHLNLN
ncbi:hypothetical protein GJ496_009315 [Pomphorhynchus laevis]|nr:hypothetical protein GJ496_009315 [Pomphorhynchus laevis]